MIKRMLSRLFPPKLGRVEGHESSLLLRAIEKGEIKAYEPDLWSWAGNAKEWRKGKWRPDFWAESVFKDACF